MAKWAHVGEKEKEDRRHPRSRAQHMSLSEQIEGLGEDRLRVFGNIRLVGEREE